MNRLVSIEEDKKTRETYIIWIPLFFSFDTKDYMLEKEKRKFLIKKRKNILMACKIEDIITKSDDILSIMIIKTIFW